MQRLLLLTLLLCLAHVVRGVVMPGAPPHARIALGSGVASHPVLAPLCHAAERAAAESTGIGGESSGQGRPEWGTWCDTDLYDVWAGPHSLTTAGPTSGRPPAESRPRRAFT